MQLDWICQWADIHRKWNTFFSSWTWNVLLIKEYALPTFRELPQIKKLIGTWTIGKKSPSSFPILNGISSNIIHSKINCYRKRDLSNWHLDVFRAIKPLPVRNLFNISINLWNCCIEMKFLFPIYMISQLPTCYMDSMWMHIRCMQKMENFSQQKSIQLDVQFLIISIGLCRIVS